MLVGVNLFSSTRRHALEEERHFALVKGLRFPTIGSLAIASIRNSVRFIHLFVASFRQFRWIKKRPTTELLSEGAPNTRKTDIRKSERGTLYLIREALLYTANEPVLLVRSEEFFSPKPASLNIERPEKR